MTIEQFYYSRWKLGGITFAAAGILVSPGVVCIVNDRYNGSANRLYFAAIATVSFLLGALVVRKFRKIIIEHRPVVTITDDGIIDTRVSEDMIAWADVQFVQFSGGRDRTLQLRLIPGARKRLRFRRMAGLYTAFLGMVGIASGPLAVRDSALFQAIQSRIVRHAATAEAARSPSLGETPAES